VPRPPPKIELTPRQRALLDALIRSRTSEQRLVERARVVAMSADGVASIDQANRLGVHRQRVDRWRRRWKALSAELTAAEMEGLTDEELRERVEAALDDAARSGAPPTFSAEQIAQIIALACEKPADSGLPISRWTPAALATEAVKRGIVGSISPRHLDRILKRG
jgi:transposase